MEKKRLSSGQKKTEFFLHKRANVHFRSLESLNEMTEHALKKAKLAKQAGNKKAELLWKKKASGLSNLARHEIEKARTLNVAKKRISSCEG